MDALKPESSLQDLIAAVARGEGPIRIAGATGAAPAYLAARLLSGRTANLRGPILAVLPTLQAAEAFADDLRFFLGHSGAGDPARQVLHFPSWEVLPYDHVSPHRGTSFERIAALGRLSVPPATPEGPAARVLALVTDARALAQRVLAPEAMRRASFELETGQTIERDDLVRRLVMLGYGGGPLAETRGEFSVRGAIVDVFPVDAADPVRIELDDDRIERMRPYDPETQRGFPAAEEGRRGIPYQRIRILPAREVILDPETVARSKEAIRGRLSEIGSNLEQRMAVLNDLDRAIYHPGVEFLLPLLDPGAVPLAAHLGTEALALLVEPSAIRTEIERFEEEIARGLERVREARRFHAEPLALWRGADETLGDLPGFRIEVAGLEIDHPGDVARAHETAPVSAPAALRFTFEKNDDLRAELEEVHTKEQALGPLVRRLAAWGDEGRQAFLVSTTPGSAERLRKLLEGYRLHLPVWRDGAAEGLWPRAGAARASGRAAQAIVLGRLSAGLRLAQDRIALVTEAEIFGPRRRMRTARESRARAAEAFAASIEDLKPDNFLVHRDHGIAQYRGLVHLELGETEGDFLWLEFAGNDRLYLPVRRIDQVQRYVGADDASPRLDRLGGAAWVKAKGKAAQAVRAMARELIEVHAARQVMRREPYGATDEMFQEFEARFPWEETPDQERAIEDVLGDLQSHRPMDRLVCGDVGYGKTEVALRAAFKVATAGRQVAVLVPTTILALQHHQTFSARFKDYPITVEELSRFKVPKAQRETLARLEAGKLDVLIGTHRLLGADVRFRDLGLLVVDEEQRFGVRHKERIKRMRRLVDVLTLTATPIPRTLHMAMLGLRDLSVINTPPEDRLAIRTFVMAWDDETVAEAIRRELARGGQVFFVHNRVQTIDAAADRLKRLVPEAKMVTAHGQMEERRLERVMLSFQRGMANVLVSTSIIESGLDLPNVNTLLVDRADTFGLAQLYQIRGRVGRGALRAYAYLFIPGEAALTADARKRLSALQDLAELGSGFKLAAHDLEIRGAGNLLGADQSGHIAAIGYEMFTELLERAVREMRGEAPEEEVEVEIDLKLPAFIPEAYVPDTSQRLVFYRRLALARAEDEIAAVETELIDRYGDLPEEVGNLTEAVRVRLLARALGVKTLERLGKELLVTWSDRARVDPAKAIALVRASDGDLRLLPDSRLRLHMPGKSAEIVLNSAKNLLQSLG